MNEDEIGTSVFHFGENVVQTAYVILVLESYRIKIFTTHATNHLMEYHEEALAGVAGQDRLKGG